MDITAAIQMMASAVDNNTRQYAEQMRDLKEVYGKDERNIKNKKKQEELLNRERLKLARKDVENAKNLGDEIRKAKAESETAKGITEDTARNIKDMTGNISSMHPEVNKFNKIFKQGAVGLNTQFQDANTIIADVTSKEYDKALAIESTIKSSEYFTKKLDFAKSTLSKFITVTGGASLTILGFSRSFDEVETSMKRQSGMFMGMAEDSALAMKLSPEALQSVAGDFRQVLLSSTDAGNGLNGAVADMNRAFNQASDGQEAYTKQAYKLTGDQGEGIRLLMTNIKMIKSQGISGSLQSLSKESASLMKTFQTLAINTGEESTAIQAKIQQHLDSATVQEEMMKLDNKGRMNKIREIASSVKMQVAMGKTVDAALRANEALSSLSGLDPKSRLKEAAKLQAVSGAMGLQGGDKAASIMRMSPNARGKDDNAFLMKFLGKLDEVSQKRMGSSNFGLAQATSTMMSQLGDSTKKIMHEANQSLTKTMALKNPKQIEKPQLSAIEDGMHWVKGIYDTLIKPVVQNPLVNIVAGLATTVGGLAVNLATMAILAKSGFGIGGSITTLGTTLMKPLSGILIATKAGAGMAGKVGMVGAAGAAGYAVGGAGMKAFETLAPEAYSDIMVDGVGKGIATVVDGVTSTFDKFTDWWSSDDKNKSDEKVVETLDKIHTEMKNVNANTQITADNTQTTALNTGETSKKVEEQTKQDVEIASELSAEDRRGYRLQMIRVPGRSTMKP